MMNYLKNQLYQNLINLNIDPGNTKFTLAVSGGADSTALFFVFLQLRKENKVNFTVCHLHHGIRKESDEELSYIINLCSKYKINLFYEKIDVPAIYKDSKKSLEIVARTERYKFFEKALKYFNSDYIVTAHHLDDIIETFFLRVIKGTGLKGAMSILPVRDHYLRPFFNITKNEILAFLEKNRIKFYEDQTNYDIKYERNYIRNIILKEIQKFYPGYRKSVYSFIELIRENEKFVSKLIPTDLIEKPYWELSYINTIEPFLIKKALEKKLRSLKKSKNIVRKEIEYIYSKINDKKFKTGIILEKGDYTIIKTIKNIYFFDEQYKKLKDKIRILEKKKSLSFGKNQFFYYIITTKKVKKKYDFFQKNGINKCLYIDKDKIIGNLYISFREDGDTIFLKPGIIKKIKKIFNDNKIPFFIRDYIPFIRDDKNIIGLMLFSDVYFIRRLLNFNLKNKFDEKNNIKYNIKYILNYQYYVTEKTKDVIKLEIK